MGTNGPILVAVPAPESIAEFKVQTSLYDASYGRNAGANVDVYVPHRLEEGYGLNREALTQIAETVVNQEAQTEEAA